MSGETVTGRDSEGRVRDFDLATQQELDAGGGPAATPTLADVLAEGTSAAGLALTDVGSVSGGPGVELSIIGNPSENDGTATLTVGNDGFLYATSGSFSGDPGQGLVAGAGNKVLWTALTTDVSSTPVGGGYVTPLVADTTAKKLYAWTGADYVQIGDWT